MQSHIEQSVTYCNKSIPSYWESDRLGGSRVPAEPHHIYTLHQYIPNAESLRSTTHVCYVFDLDNAVKKEQQTLDGLLAESNNTYTVFTYSSKNTANAKVYCKGTLTAHGGVIALEAPPDPYCGLDVVDEDLGFVWHGTQTKIETRFGNEQTTTEYREGLRHGWQIEPSWLEPSSKIERFHQSGRCIGNRVRNSDGVITTSSFTPEQIERYNLSA